MVFNSAKLLQGQNDWSKWNLNQAQNDSEWKRPRKREQIIYFDAIFDVKPDLKLILAQFDALLIISSLISLLFARDLDILSRLALDTEISKCQNANNCERYQWKV